MDLFTNVGEEIIMQTQQIPILTPLLVGIATILCTILIQAIPLHGTLGLFAGRKEP